MCLAVKCSEQISEKGERRLENGLSDTGERDYYNNLRRLTPTV